MKSIDIKRLVTAALMAALTCISTMVIPIPLPGGGFIHPGDSFVLLSGILLGPFLGGLSAGIGSMLADLLLGYSEYALATLIIKCLAAVACALTYKYVRRLRVVFAGIIGSIIVTSGYLIFESFIFGNSFAAAVVNVPLNIIQNIVGIVLSCLILPLLLKVPQIKSMLDNKN